MDYPQDTQGWRRNRSTWPSIRHQTSTRPPPGNTSLPTTTEPPRVHVTSEHRAAVRAVTEDLLRLADAGPTGDPQRPGDVAAAWLMEFARPNTRQAYAADLAAFFVWCASRPVDVWAVRRYHLADYLSHHKPDGRALRSNGASQRSPASTPTRSTWDSSTAARAVTVDR